MSSKPLTDTTSDNPSPYIRTYAKDFALLSGKKPAGMVAGSTSASPRNISSPTKVPPPPSSKETFIRPDESLVTDENSNIHKPIDLAELDNESAKVDATTFAALAMQPREEEPGMISLPRISPGDIVSKSSLQSPQPSPQPPSTERETILARLKAKVAHNPVIVPVLIHPPVPQAPLPPPEPVPVAKPAETTSPIHTYTSDFADHIDKKQASTFTVLAAEKDAPIKKRLKPKRKVNLAPVLVGTLLIVVGLGAVGGAYEYLQLKAPVTIIPLAQSLVTADAQATLPAKQGRAELLAFSDQANQSLPENNILVDVPSTASARTGSALINSLGLAMPNIVLRNIDSASTIGIVHAGDQTRPFFVLQVSSYERTFAGMLEWERTMSKDLSLLYPPYSAQNPDSLSANGQFVDQVVANHDTRAFIDTEGLVIFIYGYVDKQTLIIARNPEAFTLLVNRLNRSGN